MALIKSISGIRGTIGGKAGEGFSPQDIILYTSAYASWIRKNTKSKKIRIVVGMDARISGPMVSGLVISTLSGMGMDVIDLGLSTTPTVELAVPDERAEGGIIITASHNPKEWNALKLLNKNGEFLSEKDGNEVLKLATADALEYAPIGQLGKVTKNQSWVQKHIDKILALKIIDVKAIRERKFRVALDAVNSSGGIVLPPLLEALGVEELVKVHCEPTGDFAHNPEPLPEHLRDLSRSVLKHKAHLGFAVDPDVDRLAIVSEDGEMFGEEYTLVAVSDFVLKQSKKGGNTVSNLSSTRALADVTHKHGGTYHASAVGEVNVVAKMKETGAIIGGEGNGGIIYPELHYGRDALIGIALFLTHLAKYGKSCSMLRATYPDYFISKNKIEVTPDINVGDLVDGVREKYKKQPVNTIDGVRIEFGKEWVHLRKSNTEPIIRIYAESESESTADNLAQKIISDIRELIKSRK